MANVKFLIKNLRKNPSNVLVRFVNGRAFDFKRSTGILIDPKDWNNNKGKLRSTASVEDIDKKNNDLQRLKSHILDEYDDDYKKGVRIDSEWLKKTIDDYHNQSPSIDLDFLTYYGKNYIEELPSKISYAKGGSVGASEATIKKYNRVIGLIEEYEKHKRKKLKLEDIDPKFKNDFATYLRKKEGYSENYIGRVIKFVKTFCLDARANGRRVSDQLDKVKGFTKKAKFITFSEVEVKKIVEHDFSNNLVLDNARDWLVIGIYTGQRVSDFMRFTKDMIKEQDEIKTLVFTQVKTGAQTVAPIKKEIEEILEKRGGDFPKKIAEQNFNNYIKDVCEEVEIDDEVEGSLMDKKRRRKVEGVYPKYKLVSSHICRRTFATMHYGKVPTPAIMSVTGHTSEKAFLQYIGETRKEHINAFINYWS
ncbi:MAG: phage integrase SAM-like domain-containing protein [Cyclobacteriaceae bacterium]